MTTPDKPNKNQTSIILFTSIIIRTCSKKIIYVRPKNRLKTVRRPVNQHSPPTKLNTKDY